VASAAHRDLGLEDTQTAGETKSSAASPELNDGSQTGRFRIDGVLGRGAMGIVYRAWDPELGRSLALKVPHLDHLGGPPPPSAMPKANIMRARFLQEARGLARLSHPNVVQVFSVERFATVPGLATGACGIAMEVVEGTPIDQWLQTPRSWRDVVSVFADAGRGLMAAHRAGLVHRDFKPSNVILGNDGRVRVMDFGLATEHVAEVEPGSAQLYETLDASDDATLTRTGTTVGTPAYMAPEQHLGRAPDPRSDQFAFCVALYEALFGQRPYKGSSFQQLSTRKQLGRYQAPPAEHGVPAWLVNAVLRGLEPNPERRFDSMAELLSAMQPRPRRRRRLRAAVATLGLMAAGLVLGTVLPTTTPMVDDAGLARASVGLSAALVRSRK